MVCFFFSLLVSLLLFKSLIFCNWARYDHFFKRGRGNCYYKDPGFVLLLFLCFEKHLRSSGWETSPVIPGCHAVVGATHGKKYWHLWNLEVSCTHFPVSKTSINFHFQTWVFWEWLHCETRALFFSICRSGVTFPAVSDGPNSVRCWMLCSVGRSFAACVEMCTEKVNHIPQWAQNSWHQSGACSGGKRQAQFYLYSHPPAVVSGCGMGDRWSSSTASLKMQMSSSNYPFGCCCSLTQGEFWGEDDDKEGAALINTPQQGEGWQLGRGEALCQGKTSPSGSALAFQVALSQGLLCSSPRGCSRFWPSFSVLPPGSSNEVGQRGKVHASTFMCGIQDMWCSCIRTGAWHGGIKTKKQLCL